MLETRDEAQREGKIAFDSVSLGNLANLCKRDENGNTYSRALGKNVGTRWRFAMVKPSQQR